MNKKLDEFNELPEQYKDPNSPESQEFLRNLREKILHHILEMKKRIEEWEEEDRRNENK